MTTRQVPSRWLAGVVLLVGLFATGATPPDRGAIAPSLLAGLKWRNVGPFRAGRVSAVSGAIGQPGVFYMGMVLGGVWKTTSAGTTWYPVFDSIKDVSSIGSVEVAPSDPNIVYVGTGSTGDGNGIYKSTDAGKTWQHLPGFEDSGQIPDDPRRSARSQSRDGECARQHARRQRPARHLSQHRWRQDLDEDALRSMRAPARRAWRGRTIIPT